MRAAIAIVALSLSAASPALADTEVAAAARAFSRAQEAELEGDFDRAAKLYELADRISPAPEALRSAAKARYAARDNARAASHAEALLQRYPTDETSRAVATKLLEKLAPKLGRHKVTCRPACTLTIGGRAVGLDEAESHVFYLEPGRHELVASFDDGRAVRRKIRSVVDKTAAFEIRAPRTAEDIETALPPPEPAPRPAVAEPEPAIFVDERAHARDGGLSRAWFAGGVTITVALGAASVWSGLDVLQGNRDYEADPTIEAYEEGVRKQDRTNMLWGATAAAGLTTVVLAFFTDWSGGGDRGVTVDATAGGASLGFRGSF